MRYYLDVVLGMLRILLLRLFPPGLIIAVMICLPILLVVRHGAAKFGSRAEHYQRIDARLEAKDYYEAEKFDERRLELESTIQNPDSRFFVALYDYVMLCREAIRRAEIEERRQPSAE